MALIVNGLVAGTRIRMGVQVALLGFAFAAGGCSGGGASNCAGGDQVCPVLITSYTLQATSWQTPPAPLAVGTSVDVAFTEQSCKTSSNSRKPLPGAGCSAPYAPSQLVASTLPLADGSACPIASALVSPGTLRFTRTGPGDPRLRAGSGGLPGYCAVDVSDPGHDTTVIVL
jgi:hypothetical protein